MLQASAPCVARAALAAAFALVLAACGGDPDAALDTAPVVLTQPADQSVAAPATATFSVTAAGTAPSYEWQSSSDGGATFAPVAGGPNAPSLAIAGTSVSQSGQRYRVRVSNSAGEVTSDAALLTVTAAPAGPAFATQPLPQSIVAGASASFTVAATGTPPPTMQWRLDGASLGNGAQAGACAGAVAAGATSATLTLTTVPLACSGAVLSAVASNGVGPDATSSGATLTVTAAVSAPVVTLQPGNASVAPTTTATFIAAASGTPLPTVQWQLSIDGAVTWVDITGATSASYTTPATVLADTGKRFRAVFTNASGSATSDAAVLTVAAPAPGTPIGSPNGVAFDSAGNAFVTDTQNHTIRKVSPAGVVSTLAGLAGTTGSADGTGASARFNRPRGIAVDAAGNVYVTDSVNDTIRKITPAGVVSTLAGLALSPGSADGTGSAARFDDPTGIAIDGAGNLFVSDRGNNTIRRITPAGAVTTLAGSAATSGSSDGTGSAALFVSPVGIAIDAAGSLYVADKNNHTIRKVTPAGVVTTFAGLALATGSTDGTASAARFFGPWGVGIDPSGNLYVGDTVNHTIRKVTPAGVVTTFAGAAGSPGDVDATGSAARFNDPRDVTVDPAGNVFVADTGNNKVRKITPAGVVTTFAQ